ncbi:MAG: TetR/AcrR family transcriptional regulator [Bacteroidota bacterium]
MRLWCSMSIANRKERDKEELRRKIIAATTELLREENYATVQMRKIAERIEYSVGTIYLYFKDKDELFLAVQEEAFRQAFAFIQQIPATNDPLERLRFLGERYIRFGIENPDLYRLMFVMEKPMQALPEDHGWRSGIMLHQLLTQIVEECITAGRVRAEDPHRLSFALWSFVHGMVSLQIAQRLEIYNGDYLDCPLCGSDIDQLIVDTHNMMMNFLQYRRS